MKLLVYDHGHNLEVAIALAKSGDTVLYHVPSTTCYWDSIPGEGFEGEGITKVKDFWPIVDSVDRIFFFGSSSHFDGHLVDYLRSRDRLVIGAGSRAEELERDRWHLKKIQQQMGLPIPGAKLFHGVPALLDYLHDNPNKIVKVSRHRDLETFTHDNWESTQAQHVGKLLTVYGTDPNIQFVVESPIDTDLEVGADDILFNGIPQADRCYGYEQKDAAYIGRLVSNLPHILQKTFTALEPELDECTSFFSTEVRGQFLIDVTARCPHPPTAAMLAAYPHLGYHLIYGGTDLKAYYPYCGSLVLKSPWSKEHPLKVSFPSSFRSNVKLLNAFKRGQDYYVAPGHDEIIGYVSAAGLSVDQVIHHLNSIVETVKAKDLYYENALDSITTKIQQGRHNGISF